MVSAFSAETLNKQDRNILSEGHKKGQRICLKLLENS
jgi:hypothetical protein